MSRKPENTYIAAIHKILPSEVYREKMCNPYRGGTPDVWYSGKLGDLWAEYKFLPKVPRSEAINLGLSPLQRTWLDGRSAEGRRVCVIVGSPEGGIILEQGAWSLPISDRDFRAGLLSKQEIAEYIYKKTEALNAIRICTSKRRTRGPGRL